MALAGARRFVRIAAIVILIAPVAARQNVPAGADAEYVTLLNTARVVFTTYDWDRGIAAYETLVAAARTNGAAVWEGRGLLGLGRIANETARYADARRYANEALAIFERLNAADDAGDANVTLGNAADLLNDADAAKAHYERAVAAYRTSGNAHGAIVARFRLFNVTSAAAGDLDGFATLQAEAHAVGDKELEGDILHAWGDELFQLSVYEPAIEKLEAAAALFEETHSTMHLGTTYTSLGRVYRAHGQPAAAVELQLKALKILETLHMPRLTIQSLNAVAVASQVLGNVEQARIYYERALAAAERSGVSSYVDFIAANLAGYLIEVDTDLERARTLLERAIAAGPAFATSLRYTQLSEGYFKLGRHDAALSAAERALSTCRTPADCIYAHAASGRVHLAAGHDAAALADQKAILAAIERMHQTLAPSDLLKQSFTRLWEDAYSIAIDLHFRRGEYREALEASELARSRAEKHEELLGPLARRREELARLGAELLHREGAAPIL
jgi:tetratricopeptide (TPR) repeat protein